MIPMCYCRQDRGVVCFYCLTVSRLRIIARDLQRRENFEEAARLFRFAEELAVKAKQAAQV